MPHVSIIRFCLTFIHATKIIFITLEIAFFISLLKNSIIIRYFFLFEISFVSFLFQLFFEHFVKTLCLLRVELKTTL